MHCCPSCSPSHSPARMHELAASSFLGRVPNLLAQVAVPVCKCYTDSGRSSSSSSWHKVTCLHALWSFASHDQALLSGADRVCALTGLPICHASERASVSATQSNCLPQLASVCSGNYCAGMTTRRLQLQHIRLAMPGQRSSRQQCRRRVLTAAAAGPSAYKGSSGEPPQQSTTSLCAAQAHRYRAWLCHAVPMWPGHVMQCGLSGSTMAACLCAFLYCVQVWQHATPCSPCNPQPGCQRPAKATCTFNLSVLHAAAGRPGSGGATTAGAAATASAAQTAGAARHEAATPHQVRGRPCSCAGLSCRQSCPWMLGKAAHLLHM